MTEPPEIVRSPIIPAAFPHAFATRQGGVSQGRYASLNLSTGWGDDPSAVAENRRRYLAALGLAGVPLVTVRQVHGPKVVAVESTELPPLEADAMVAAAGARVALGILTADCVPILFADPGTGAVAAAHAGWRGTVAGIAGETVHALVQRGGVADRLVAALGPCICLDCFEVGEEVADAFAAASLGEVVVRRPAWRRPHVDLRAANALVLRRAGLQGAHIDDAPPCTMCDAARFYSFRRDGAGIGQHMAVIAPPR